MFEDQDTRDFYEGIPDVFDMVPAVLLGEEAMARRAKVIAEAEAERAAQAEGTVLSGGGGEGQEQEGEKSEHGVGEASSAEENRKEEEDKLARKKAEDEAKAAELHVKKEEEEAAAAQKRAAAAAGSGGKGEGEGEGEQYEEEEDPNAIERAKFEEFVAHLYTCQSRDLIDKAAERFCYLNNKLNRRKLARALFQVTPSTPSRPTASSPSHTLPLPHSLSTSAVSHPTPGAAGGMCLQTLTP